MKEFNTFGGLLFEGDYLGGEREKGKEYNYENDYLEYIGEFSNGKRNGKGEEFAKNSELIFKGEYKDGKRWNGNVYNNGEIVFEIKEGITFK